MMTEEYPMSDLAIPPGEYLEEVLDDLGMSKEDLARRMGRPATKLSQIFNGSKQITPETALQLETVVGVPAHIWTGLEAEYRLTLEKNKKVEEEAVLREEAKLATKFCYNDLVQLNELPKTQKPVERSRALRRYFGVTSLAKVMGSERYQQAAFRCGAHGEKSPEALAAWLRYGERKSQAIDTDQYDEKRLRAMLEDLRLLTTKSSPDVEIKLRTKLARCGVALVICPHFKKTNAHGATFRLTKSKVVLMITKRYTWADMFWFSLFHEIGHILLHDLSSVMIENESHDQREDEANQFAANVLIPEAQYAEFIKRNQFTERSVCQFSKAIRIHTGIVVGRLQHEKLVPHSWLQNLREQLLYSI